MPARFGGSSALLTVSPRGQGFRGTRAPAYATWSLIAVTVAIYLIQLAADETRASELVLRYGVTPEIFNGGERPFGGFPPLLTPLTAMFLHGSWDHLLGNMIYLWVFGDDIEKVLGPLPLRPPLSAVRRLRRARLRRDGQPRDHRVARRIGMRLGRDRGLSRC